MRYAFHKLSFVTAVSMLALVGCEEVPGPQGEQGAQGEQGVQGEPGQDGDDGDDGDDGRNGQNGQDGASGAELEFYYVSGTETRLGSGRTELAEATCNDGDWAVGGGYDCQFASGYTVERSQWTQETGTLGQGWTVWVQGGSGSCWAKVACADTNP